MVDETELQNLALLPLKTDNEVICNAKALESKKQTNPAVLGLAGFAIATLTLQFFHLGLMVDRAPFIFAGFTLGGVAQIIAGIHACFIGDEFNYGAFTVFGCFWIGLGSMQGAKTMDLLSFSPAALSWLLLPILFYTIILVGAVWRKPMAAFVTLVSLLPGLITIIIAHWLDSDVITQIAGVLLTICSLCAFYTLAAEIYSGIYGKYSWLPLGRSPYDLWNERKLANGKRSNHSQNII